MEPSLKLSNTTQSQPTRSLSSLSPEEAAIHLDTLDSTQDEQPGSMTSMSEQPPSGSSSSLLMPIDTSQALGQIESMLVSLFGITSQLILQQASLNLQGQKQTRALKELEVFIIKSLAWVQSAGPEPKTSSSK